MLNPAPKDVLAALRANRFEEARDFALREHRPAGLAEVEREAINDGRYQGAICEIARRTGDWL